MGNQMSAEITVSTGTPQGCCLSPKLSSLYTYDCASTHYKNMIIKHANETPILSLRGGDESSSREPVHSITIYGEDNDLFNLDKTKELILDFQRKAPLRHHFPSEGLMEAD